MKPWHIAVALCTALAVVIVLITYAWMQIDVVLPWPAVLAMVLGVVLSLAIGFGLMALVFYSSRSGHDENAAQSNRLPPLRRERERD